MKVTAFLGRVAARGAGNQPLVGIAPEFFLGNKAFVSRVAIGAEEQVGIIIGVDKEDVGAIGGWDEIAAEALDVIIAAIKG